MYEGLSPELGVELTQLRAAFQQLQTASAVVVGSEPVFVVASDRLRSLLGRDPAGHPLREILPELSTPERHDAIRMVYTSGEPSLIADVVLAHDVNGAIVPRKRVDLRFTPLRDETGSVFGLLLDVLDADDSRRAERELRAGLARLEAILAAVQDGVTVQDSSGRLVYANDAAARLVGLPDGRTFVNAQLSAVLADFELLDGQGQPLEPDALPGRRALRGEPDPERLIAYRDRRTGEERWSMVRAHAVRDGTGRIVMVVSAFQDLTELMRREQRLIESEARFRAMADTAPVLIWQAGTDAQCDYFNLPWLAFTGRSLEQELGEGWIDGVHADDRAQCVATFHDAFAAQGPFRMEYRLRRNDGEYRWILGHGVPRFAPGGSFLGYIGSCIDVHDHIEQERALEGTTHRLAETAAELAQKVRELRQQKAESQRATERAEIAQRRSAFIAEAGRTLASSLDPDVRLRSLAQLSVPRLADWCTVHVVDNEGAVRRLIAHADPASVESLRRLEELYPPRLDDSSAISRVLQSGTAELYEDIPEALLKSVAHDERHLEMLRELALRSAMVVPLIAHGQVLGVLALVATGESGRRYTADDLELAEDVASRAAIAIHNARLYEEAQAANRAKANFLAVMSHELRTPLTAVVGNADLLELQLWGPINEKQRERVGRIKASARHLMTIIDEILGFSRLEAAREETHIEDFDVTAVVRETLHLAETDAAAKGIGISADYGEAPREWTSDPAKLRQILINLVGNAVKFTDEGCVEVSVAQNDGALVVHVRDPGPGIPADQIDRIFEPFTQVDQSRTRTKGGLGLGLPLSRRLARLLGGDVTVASAPGSGSTFTLRLPRGVPSGQ